MSTQSKPNSTSIERLETIPHEIPNSHLLARPSNHSPTAARVRTVTLLLTALLVGAVIIVATIEIRDIIAEIRSGR